MITELLKVLARRAEPDPRQMHPTLVSLVPHYPPDGPSGVQSWLGGMPEMPADTPWPRDNDGAPYVFLAQIACADLPPEIWRGLGPRDGWLVFFNHPENLDPRILHVPARGPARHEGGGIGTTGLVWSGAEAKLSDGPVFRKLPVKPVRCPMPEDDAGWLADPSPGPVLPVSFGQYRRCLDALVERLDTSPWLRKVQYFREHNLAYFKEPEQRAKAKRAIEDDLAALEKIDAANRGLREEVTKWRKDCEAHPTYAPLPSGVWRRLVEACTGLAVPQITIGRAQHEQEAVYRSHVAPYSTLWHPVRTVGEMRNQWQEIMRFWGHSEFKCRPSAPSLAQIEANCRKDAKRVGGWSERHDAKVQVWREKLEAFERVKPSQGRTSRLVSYLRKMIEDRDDAELLDCDEVEALVTFGRSYPRFKEWLEVVHEPIYAIPAFRMAEGTALAPDFTEAGVTGPSDLLTALAADQTALFWSEDATLEQFAGMATDSPVDVPGLNFMGDVGEPFQSGWNIGPFVDGDNAVLLHLASSKEIGWLWDDVDTLNIHVPFEDLAEMRFDRASAWTNDGI